MVSTGVDADTPLTVMVEVLVGNADDVEVAEGDGEGEGEGRGEESGGNGEGVGEGKGDDTGDDERIDVGLEVIRESTVELDGEGTGYGHELQELPQGPPPQGPLQSQELE